MKKLKSVLNDKLAVEYGREMDNQFWAKFDSEFNVRDERWSWKRLVEFEVPMAVAASLVVFLITFHLYLYKRNTTSEMAAVATMIEMEVAIENLDVFSEVEVAELNDNDWDLLLAGT